MRELPVRRLGQITYALVDDDVYEWAQHFKWHLRGPEGWKYATRSVRVGLRSDQNIKRIALHREVAAPGPNQQVDHIDGNTLNNTRANLRLVTHKQNQQNRRGAYRTSKTGVRGVVFRAHLKKRPYRAELKVLGKPINVGHFATLEEADAAVRAARRKYMTHSSECENEPDAQRSPC